MNQAELREKLWRLIAENHSTQESVNAALNVTLDLITAEKVAVLEEIQSLLALNTEGEIPIPLSKVIDTMITAIKEGK